MSFMTQALNYYQLFKFMLINMRMKNKKTPTISLFNNYEKLVQILLEFSQQIVEGYESVLAKFC